MKHEPKRSAVKPFIMGCIMTAFIMSLTINLLFYRGILQPPAPAAVEQTDDQKLAAIYGGL